MKIKYWELDKQELERICASVMSTVIYHAEEEGIIKHEDAEWFCDNHTPVIILKESLLQKIKDKIFCDKNENKETLHFDIVKLTFESKPNAKDDEPPTNQ
jgi:hypothetical protein